MIELSFSTKLKRPTLKIRRFNWARPVEHSRGKCHLFKFLWKFFWQFFLHQHKMPTINVTKLKSPFSDNRPWKTVTVTYPFDFWFFFVFIFGCISIYVFLLIHQACNVNFHIDRLIVIKTREYCLMRCVDDIHQWLKTFVRLLSIFIVELCWLKTFRNNFYFVFPSNQSLSRKANEPFIGDWSDDIVIKSENLNFICSTRITNTIMQLKY